MASAGRLLALAFAGRPSPPGELAAAPGALPEDHRTLAKTTSYAGWRRS